MVRITGILMVKSKSTMQEIFMKVDDRIVWKKYLLEGAGGILKFDKIISHKAQLINIQF